MAPGSAADATPGSRFRLLRVSLPSAPARERGAEALISVDGLPSRAYRVGEVVVGAVVLQSVKPTSALLGPAGGPAAVVLNLGSAGSASAPSSEPLPTTTAGAGDWPAIRPASAPAVDRTPVPVTGPDHGVDTSNH